MKKIVLGLDVGHGNTKLVFSSNSRAWGELCFKSTAPREIANASGVSGMSSSLTGSLDRVAIAVDETNYLVGPQAHFSGGGVILGTDYVERPEYMALVKGAIYYMLERSKSLNTHIDVLVAGLPVSNWQAKNSALTTLSLGPHRIPAPPHFGLSPGETIEVSVGRVVVLPQPLGALQAAMFGAQSESLDSSVQMVIDVGFNTFDWFTSVGMQPDFQRSGSLQGGVSQLLKLVSNAAGNQLGVGSLDLLVVEKGLEDNSINVHGQRLDMTQFAPLVQAAAKQVVERFRNSVEMAMQVDKIYLVGGGAKYYLDSLRALFRGHEITIEPSGVMSNARGFFLMGTMLVDLMESEQ